MSEEGRFTIHLEQLEGYEFKVRFDWDQVPDLIMDEPPPLGEGSGPNAARMLAAAVGNCLSASLLYCLSRQDAPTHSVRSSVSCAMVRNERGRLRVGEIEVCITLGEALAGGGRMRRCLELFEDFCVVTASIREGVQVRVAVRDQAGNTLYEDD